MYEGCDEVCNGVGKVGTWSWWSVDEDAAQGEFDCDVESEW